MPASATALEAVVVAATSATFESALDEVGRLSNSRPNAVVLVAVNGLSASQIAALLGAGAIDFITDPVADYEIDARLRRAADQAAPPPCGGAGEAAHPRIRDCVGCSPNFTRQIARLPTFALCDAGVLILGETGTGKEVCAQAIHYLSRRASNPWVAVNCAAIPTELIENELFGHIKGAYTNAHASRVGLVREAEGGTLFLDDVDCLPLAAQAKLLRFLQEREYRLVGDNKVQHADVRVIAAANTRLPQLVEHGAFRRDLFFRLNVLPLELPPLRDRRGDIAALAQHFIRAFDVQFKRGVVGIEPPALRRLLAHDWPGNVRELKHLIERAVLMASGPILTADDLELGDPPGSAELDSFRAAKARAVASFERGYIESLLAVHQGNVTHAARAAKKNRRAFFELIRKHRIQPQQFRSPDAG